MADSGGLLGELASGYLEMVPRALQEDVLEHLLDQESLCESNLDRDMKILKDAWGLASNVNGETTLDRRRVHGSTVPVSRLNDEALEAWIKIYLLGNAEYYDYN